MDKYIKEGGAGDWGTDKARETVQQQTPGQQTKRKKPMKSFRKMIEDVAIEMEEARKMPKNPAIDNDPKVKAARKDHAAGIWDGNVDKEGEAIVFVKGKPYTVTNNNG